MRKYINDVPPTINPFKKKTSRCASTTDMSLPSTCTRTISVDTPRKPKAMKRKASDKHHVPWGFEDNFQDVLHRIPNESAEDVLPVGRTLPALASVERNINENRQKVSKFILNNYFWIFGLD